jgi:hypothetical protein
MGVFAGQTETAANLLSRSFVMNFLRAAAL